MTTEPFGARPTPKPVPPVAPTPEPKPVPFVPPTENQNVPFDLAAVRRRVGEQFVKGDFVGRLTTGEFTSLDPASPQSVLRAPRDPVREETAGALQQILPIQEPTRFDPFDPNLAGRIKGLGLAAGQKLAPVITAFGGRNTPEGREQFKATLERFVNPRSSAEASGFATGELLLPDFASPLEVGLTVGAPGVGRAIGAGARAVGRAAPAVERGLERGARLFPGGTQFVAGRQAAAQSRELNTLIRTLQKGQAAGENVAGLQQQINAKAQEIVDLTIDAARKAGLKEPTTEKVKLIALAKMATPGVEETAALRSAELSQRVARAAPAFEQAPILEAQRKASQFLKGGLPKSGLQFPAEILSTDDLASLLTTIRRTNASFFDKYNATTAIQNFLLGRQLPRDFELKLFERFFGSEVAQAIGNIGQRPEFAKQVLNALNLPRAVLASWDMSAPLRQGIVLLPGHPKEAVTAFNDMVRSFFSTPHYNKLRAAIQARPNAKLYHDSGLYFADVWKPNRLSQREEAWASGWTEKLPGIVRSQRAFSAYLDRFRADIFDTIVNNWAKQGVTPQTNPKSFQQIASFINHATGRGNLGDLNDLMPALNVAFFAPRLIWSRFQTVADLGMSSSMVRGQVARDLAAFAGMAVGTLSLLQFTPGVGIELDPRSSDFAKVRVGKQRWDFLGGYQQLIRYITQVVTGERKTLGSGRIEDAAHWDTIFRFLRSKTSPLAGAVWDFASGTDFLGNPIDPDVQTLQREWWNRVIPLFWQDVVEAVQEEGLRGGVGTIPAFFGVTVNTFPTTFDRQQEVAERLMDQGAIERKPFDELNERDFDKINADPAIQEIFDRIDAAQTPDIRTKVDITFDQWGHATQTAEAELRTRLDAGVTGSVKREAIQEFIEARFRAGDLLFEQPDVAQWLAERKAGKERQIEDVLREQYWAIQPEENPETLRLDFEGQRQQREVLLAQARELGVDIDYITSRNREDQIKDPVVLAAIKEWDDFRATQERAGWNQAYRQSPDWQELPANIQALYEEARRREIDGSYERWASSHPVGADRLARLVNTVNGWNRDGQLRLRLNDVQLDRWMAEFYQSVPLRDANKAHFAAQREGTFDVFTVISSGRSVMDAQARRLLWDAGIRTLADLAQLNANQLAEITNHRPETVERWDWAGQARRTIAQR